MRWAARTWVQARSPPSGGGPGSRQEEMIVGLSSGGGGVEGSRLGLLTSSISPGWGDWASMSLPTIIGIIVEVWDMIEKN